MKFGKAFFKAYLMLLIEPVYKKSFALTTIIASLSFYIASNQVLFISGSKLIFLVITLSVILNFYFCVERQISLDNGKNSLIMINFYAAVLLFSYFASNSKICFWISLNTFAIIKFLKTRELKISQLGLANNLIMLIFAAFYGSFDELSLYLFPLISLSFAVFASLTKTYETLTNFNHYLGFNLAMLIPLFFSLEDASTYGNQPTVLDVVFVILVVVLGVVQLNLFYRLLFTIELKFVLFTINEFTLILVSLLTESKLAITVMTIGAAISFYFVDFQYKNNFFDPENENLGNNEDLMIEMQILKDKFKNIEKISELALPLVGE
jgi:hypothetical protein